MTEESGSVTLVFYAIQQNWWREPLLNLVAAAAQMSKYSHVEIAIGNTSGEKGEMVNVARIYNDNVGCELCSRTGRNPSYTYLQLGCSKQQEVKMLNFAKACVGKPFSQSAMARSVFWPRTSTYKDFFCAELVASILKEGGLIDQASNPGAATPENLHALFRNRGSTTANPYVLRQEHLTNSLTTDSIVQKRVYKPPQLTPAPQLQAPSFAFPQERRTALRVVSGVDQTRTPSASPGIVFTLESLKMGPRTR